MAVREPNPLDGKRLVASRPPLMPGYLRQVVREFVALETRSAVGQLEARHAGDGFETQLSAQTRAWEDSIVLIQSAMRDLTRRSPASRDWSVILEYPLYRLRKRIDLVVVASSTIVVVEIRVGESAFRSADRRQVEEYGLDLRLSSGESRSEDRSDSVVHSCTSPRRLQSHYR